MEKRGCTLKSFEITHPDAVEVSNFLDVTFNDERIKIAEGQPAFKAVFETPTGAKTLS
ncbi:hypothetical protein [Lentilitoribacter sp. EG35]|uniref:hypothetical protein n=1 Tax=Lentilitoribacter sp. EG35 TaxID=3234192 RepID=UPI003460A75E